MRNENMYDTCACGREKTVQSTICRTCYNQSRGSAYAKKEKMDRNDGLPEHMRVNKGTSYDEYVEKDKLIHPKRYIKTNPNFLWN